MYILRFNLDCKNNFKLCKVNNIKIYACMHMNSYKYFVVNSEKIESKNNKFSEYIFPLLLPDRRCEKLEDHCSNVQCDFFLNPMLIWAHSYKKKFKNINKS